MRSQILRIDFELFNQQMVSINNKDCFYILIDIHITYKFNEFP